MDWQLSPYVPALVISGIVALTTSIFAWRWRAAQGAGEIAAVAALSGIWSWLYALELSSATFEAALIWAKIEYLCITGVPTMLLVFAMRYTGHDRWLAGRRWLAFALFPALTVLTVWTNDLHRLYWSEMNWVASGPVQILKFAYGPLFWTFIAYSYICVTSATWLLLTGILRAPRAYRGSTIALLVAIAAIWGGNALYISGLSPWGYLDLTPVASTISGLAITLGIFRLRLFHLIPIAHNLVFEQMGDGVVVVDIADQVLDLNTAALRDLGLRREQAIGASTDVLFGRWPQLFDRYRGALQLGDEMMITRSNGTSRWFDLRISPLYDRRGNLRGRVAIWHDISERKQAEESLRVARDAAEAASRAKSAFLANMSHELRTPLSTIMGYCQLLRVDVEQQELEDALRDLNSIELAGGHLLHLIANLLHLAQIEASSDQGQVTPIDLPALVGELAESVRPAVARRRNQLRLQLDAMPAVFHSDPARLRQVLLNILDNAAKFTEGGTITLRVARDVPGDGPPGAPATLGFEIADTGVGIAPDELARIFEVFVEPDSPKRRRFGGTGVGLAIAQHFCRAMGGEIQVTSAPGQGTSVIVRLPDGGPDAHTDSGRHRDVRLKSSDGG